MRLNWSEETATRTRSELGCRATRRICGGSDISHRSTDFRHLQVLDDEGVVFFQGDRERGQNHRVTGAVLQSDSCAAADRRNTLDDQFLGVDGTVFGFHHDAVQLLLGEQERGFEFDDVGFQGDSTLMVG